MLPYSIWPDQLKMAKKSNQAKAIALPYLRKLMHTQSAQLKNQLAPILSQDKGARTSLLKSKLIF